jgi:formylmethanofuran dehydrogenase subunit D
MQIQLLSLKFFTREAVPKRIASLCYIMMFKLFICCTTISNAVLVISNAFSFRCFFCHFDPKSEKNLCVKTGIILKIKNRFLASTRNDKTTFQTKPCHFDPKSERNLCAKTGIILKIKNRFLTSYRNDIAIFQT